MLEKTGDEVARDLANFCNGLSSADKRAFIEQLTQREHRTIQQRVMTLFVGVVQEYAKLSEGEYDLRNEATVMLCRDIVKNVEFRKLHLPLI
jgi:hypothetical protein